MTPRHPLHRRPAARPAVALLTVLIVLMLLGLMGAGFATLMQAETAGQALYEQQVQARAACDAGFAVALAAVRQDRFDPEKWLDNPDLFRDIALTGANSDSSSTTGPELKIGSNAKAETTGLPVWRYSVVRPDYEDDAKPIFGVMDEGGKFNLNSFTPQTAGRFRRALIKLPNVTEEMADSLIDWLDADDDTRPSGGESGYYGGLNPPYAPPNGRLHSVDELLLVKGWTPKLLYGEDTNVNGLLDPNEDDGDQSDPPDDGNGVLNRGLYPFLTIWSVEANTSNDNKPRIPLQTSAAAPLLEELFGAEKAKYLGTLLQMGVQFRSPADLLGGDGLRRRPQTSTSQPGQGGSGGGRGSRQPAAGGGTGRNTGGDSGGAGGAGGSGGSGGAAGSGGTGGRGSGGVNITPGGGNNKAKADDALDGEDDLDTGDKADAAAEPDAADTGTPAAPTNTAELYRQRNTRRPQPGTTGRGAAASNLPPIPASPFGPADLPILLDRFTAVVSAEQVGLININTAPAEVLATLPGLDTGSAQAIVSARKSLSADEMRTPAWLLTSGAIQSLAQYQRIVPYVTARASVFSIESVGHAYQSGVQVRRRTVMQAQGIQLRPLYVQEFVNMGPAYDFVGLAQKEGTVGR